MKFPHLLLISICVSGLLYPIHYFSGPPPVALDSSVPNQYCIGCHNQKAKVGGLTLDSIDYTDLAKNAETWEKVIRKIKTGMMPPSPRPATKRLMPNQVGVGAHAVTTMQAANKVRQPRNSGLRP